ncbi:YhjD/YihY/BrkB family envelope integrity protein [Streptomyces sp. NPDC059009]|uniref:YhjD/YihY/BrkB family envelope integrity protein n=1 Tax=Streptomyces sp. NPDC059009 TaxID=3346694 RepID=UPI0036921489
MTITSAAQPLVGRLVQQLVHVNILDMATRLAAQAFLAALPMLIAVASFAPAAVERELLRSVRTLMGSGGPVVAQVEAVNRGEDVAAHSWGAAGVLVALLSATAFTRALQRLCERSWHLPRSGVRLTAWRWAVWLLVWIVMLVVQGMLRRAFGAGAILGVPLQLVAAVLMWWWTQHLLLAGRVRWLPLLPGAVLTGAGVVLFCGVSGLWLPRALRLSVERYGALGSVFTVLSWLIVFFTVVVFGVAVGRMLAQEEFLRRRLGPAAPPSPERTAAPGALSRLPGSPDVPKSP